MRARHILRVLFVVVAAAFAPTVFLGRRTISATPSRTDAPGIHSRVPVIERQSTMWWTHLETPNLRGTPLATSSFVEPYMLGTLANVRIADLWYPPGGAFLSDSNLGSHHGTHQSAQAWRAPGPCFTFVPLAARETAHIRAGTASIRRPRQSIRPGLP